MITIKIIIFSDETRNEKNCEIQDQVGPGPERFKKSRTDSDQDQIFSEKLGPTRTYRSPDLAVRGSLDDTSNEFDLDMNLGPIKDPYTACYRGLVPRNSRIYHVNNPSYRPYYRLR